MANGHWFSEIEPDGAIGCPDPTSDVVVKTQRDVIEARFGAYRRGHAAWMARNESIVDSLYLGSGA